MPGAMTDVHRGDPAEREVGNRRNGTSRRTVGTGSERIVPGILRERQGRFDAVLTGTYRRRVPDWDRTWTIASDRLYASQQFERILL